MHMIALLQREENSENDHQLDAYDNNTAAVRRIQKMIIS